MQGTSRLLCSCMSVLLMLLGMWAYPAIGVAQEMKTEGDVSGFIIATADGRVSVGEGDVVIIDRGQDHGVGVGDHYLVYQDEWTVIHQRSGETVPISRQVIGEMTVTETFGHTAKASIISSQFEIAVGSPVVAVTLPPEADNELQAQAEARLARLSPCLEMARQALNAAQLAGVAEVELASAKAALASAEMAFEQAAKLLAQGDLTGAISRLDIALSDCLTAQDAVDQAHHMAASPGSLERYTVARGDTLWGISAREIIYSNALMWPIIYKANREQIRDPDVIFPRQVFAIPRDFAASEAEMAIERARRRGRWRLYDGPDRYILGER